MDEEDLQAVKVSFITRSICLKKIILHLDIKILLGPLQSENTIVEQVITKLH